MSYSDPYQAYSEGSVYSTSPLGLVVALYEGAIEAVGQAKQRLVDGDIAGRGKSINKAVQILTELLLSLDHEKGGEVSANLQRLYGYMQRKLLEAHASQAAGPMTETENLLNTLLQGWYEVAEKVDRSQVQIAAAAQTSEPKPQAETALPYGFFEELSEVACGVSATF